MNQTHALMLKTNHYLIKGGELTDAHKLTITNKLLAAKSTTEQVKRRFGLKNKERHMYPYSYVLPYNGGEKLVTILNQQPKTQILSMNSYELEILRLLNLLTPNNPDVKNMSDQAFSRLKKTCFGNRGCGTGECYDAGLVSLRFLSTAAPSNEYWISNLINSYNAHAEKRKRSRYYGRDYTRYYIWYYWLCLSELPYELAGREINKYKNDMLAIAKQGMTMYTEEDKILAAIKIHIIKNCISRLPEYESIRNIQPTENDRRIYLEA